jgi:hypothetical protein
MLATDRLPFPRALISVPGALDNLDPGEIEDNRPLAIFYVPRTLLGPQEYPGIGNGFFP